MNYYPIKTLFFLFIISLSIACNAKSKKIVVGFYNVENLFDTIHDDRKNDYEYLPDGKKEWNSDKYIDKLKNISRAILAMNDWQGPDIIGLCEIENRQVLEDLIKYTQLKEQNYRICHFSSPDPRGIDVGLLYKHKVLYHLSDTAISLQTRTRNIHRSDFIYKKDTLSFYVNHWSSRRGGEEKSAPKRARAASILKADLLNHPDYLQVIMGDFNDSPFDNSIQNIANFYCDKDSSYYNTSCLCEGTLKYLKEWHNFDQIIVNHKLLRKNPKVEMQRLEKEWLFEEDKRYGGLKPLRSHSNQKHQSGFSDHLPVYITLKL